MKKYLVLLLIVSATLSPVTGHAQIPILDIIKAGVKKVIKAIDLKIQRQQNKVIWLQNAQKTLENTMSKMKLEEIGDWVEKQKDQYKEYYDELARVKSVITYYQRIRDITQKQVMMVEQYKTAWAMVRQDKHFTPAELDYMERVYSGILAESLKNIDQITLVIKAVGTSMSDAKRLDIINAAADKVETNYRDLNRFTSQQKILSLQRAKTAEDVATVKKLYGL